MLQGMSANSRTTPAAQTQGPVPTAQEAEKAPKSRDVPQVTTAGAPSEMGGYDLQENDVMLTSEQPAAHSNGDAEPASQARYSKSAMARMPKVDSHLMVHSTFSAVLLARAGVIHKRAVLDMICPLELFATG